MFFLLFKCINDQEDISITNVQKENSLAVDFSHSELLLFTNFFTN